MTTQHETDMPTSRAGGWQSRRPDKKLAGGTKFAPVNFRKSTLEIRIFQATLKAQSFLKKGIRILGLKQGYRRPASISLTSVDMSAP